jgi:hypothetical protein
LLSENKQATKEHSSDESINNHYLTFSMYPGPVLGTKDQHT